jgi:hypothetical protein
MRFAFINEHRCTWPIRVMCRVLAVSCSGFFAWLGRAPSGACIAPGQGRREAV